MPRLLRCSTIGCAAVLLSIAGSSLGCSSDSAAGSCGADGICSSGGDPENGDFTLDEALVGLPGGSSSLKAIIDTDLGAITCTLNGAKAPVAVANFVGLARGQRAWLDVKTSTWVKRPYYDGLLFHRVIPEFMAQGGDPTGTGTGGPGYKLNDEITDLKHVAGALAYANSGPNSSGSQFYITETEQPSLDGSYTVFGLCTPVSVVSSLTHVQTNKATNRPLTDLHMKTITITHSAP